MSASSSGRFLEEAVGRGLLTPVQAEDVRRLRAATAEVGIDLGPDEIAVRKGFLTREQADEILRALARLRVGRYEVIERLGEGGSGVVWKARDTKTDEVVALKLLSAEARRDAKWRERFLREARVALTLSHPNIVRGIDCGESDGYLWFAMEFVPGGSVEDRLRREGRLPEPEALRIAREVVGALEHVRGWSIVHRDLKPGNLLLAADGSVRVCDLGLARPMREEVERDGGDTALAGTPLYASPEQIRDPVHLDWRSDVYNLGATLFHMLAGRPPFAWEPGTDLLRRHLEEVPPSPREFALEVTPGAAAVTLKMLRKDPADRYASLADLAEDLDAVLDGRPPLRTATFAPRPGEVAAAVAPPADLREQERRRWIPVTAAFAITLVGLGATAVLAISILRATSLHSLFLSPGDETPPAGPKEPPPPPPPEPPPQVPRDPTTPAPSSEAAGRALAAAEKISADRPMDFVARRDAWRFVLEHHAGTPEAAVAEERLRSIDEDAEAAAEREYRSRSERAATAEAAGRLGTAITILETFPAELRDTRAGRRAEAEARQLAAEAARRVAKLLEESSALAARDRYDEAKAKLDEAHALGLPEAQRDIILAQRDLDRGAAAFEQRREEQRARFDRVYGAAVLDAGSRGVEAALAALDAAGPDISAWSREVESLRDELQRIPQAELSPGPAASPRSLRDAAFAQLALGRLGEAESLLARLGATGSRADDLAAALERVRAVLVGAAEDHLVLAEKARAARRTDDAQEHVRRALSRIPDYPRAQVMEATLLADAGKTDAAIDVLVLVLSGDDAPAIAHLRMGQVLATRSADADRARQELELFLALADDGDPLRAEARASIEALQGRRTEALLRDLREALRRARLKDQPGPIIEAAESILALSPADPEALLAVGETYPEVGRVRDGWRALKRLLALGGAGTAQSKAARALRKMEERWASTRATREAAAAAKTQLDAGEVYAGREAFDAILREAPFLEEALAGAAEARLRQRPQPASEDVALARSLLDDLIARNPENLRGRELRAEAMLAAGDAKGAREEAKAAIAAGSLRAEPETTAGFAALRLGDTAAALEHFRESLARRRTARALMGRALAWLAQRDQANARAEMDMLIREFGVPRDLDAEVRALLARLEMEVVEEGGEK